MRRIVPAIAAVLLIAAVWFYRRPELPEAPAARVRRANLVQLLTTNGKVEALGNISIYVRSAVTVLKVNVQQGDAVRRGQRLAEVDDTAAREAVRRAQAGLEIAGADRARVERGGSVAEMTEIDSSLARARLEKEVAEREVAALQRLLERQAASRSELLEQQQHLVKAEADLSALERKRRSLLGPEDRERVQARIREAEIAVAQATHALQQTEIAAPADGILYSLSLRPGVFYNAGAGAGQVGQVDKVRVRVLVDEPELGRLQVAQPVRITWDALPAGSWQGVVERLPSEVQMAGTRSVGEVLCTIDNPGRRLLPNITVNVEIRTGGAENALAIPRDAVVREGGATFALVVDSSGVIVRQPIRLGIHDAARFEVLDGLSENQTVVLPGERVLAPGQKVRPVIAT